MPPASPDLAGVLKGAVVGSCLPWVHRNAFHCPSLLCAQMVDRQELAHICCAMWIPWPPPGGECPVSPRMSLDPP